MDDSLRDACEHVFSFPATTGTRRHGPQGYADYQSYKPWLRDEFTFRCVYCLMRERWESDGHHGFGVEHVRPQSKSPDKQLDYDNLVYACNTCNSSRRDVILPADVVMEPGSHLQSRTDGTVEPLSDLGSDVVELCRLNRPLLVAMRRRIQNLINVLRKFDQSEAVDALRDLLAYPSDLPNLRTLRPPDGNVRSDGVDNCHFEKRQRGELPIVY